MRRSTWYGVLCGLVGLMACADDSADDADHDAQVGDASLDARAGDSSIDASDAQLDATIKDAQRDASGACDVRDFVVAHRSCSGDQECVIVGACSGGFGFYAVNVAARDEAQRLSDQTPRECAAFDGPLYHAVCEHGWCVRRPTGHACGEMQHPDGGLPPGHCPDRQERYQAWLGDASARATDCYQRCSGPADTRCGAGQTCQETDVCAAEAFDNPLTSSCAPFTLPLCRP